MWVRIPPGARAPYTRVRHGCLVGGTSVVAERHAPEGAAGRARADRRAARRVRERRRRFQRSVRSSARRRAQRSRRTTPAKHNAMARHRQHVVDSIRELERTQDELLDRFNESEALPPRHRAHGVGSRAGLRMKAMPPTVSRSSEGANGVPTRVVIAEDEAIIRLDLKEILEEEGYEVVGETGRGDEAVELVRACGPTSPSSTSRCRAWTASRPPAHHRRAALRRAHAHRVLPARARRAGPRRRRAGLPGEAVPEERPHPGDRGGASGASPSCGARAARSRSSGAARGPQDHRPGQGRADGRARAEGERGVHVHPAHRDERPRRRMREVAERVLDGLAVVRRRVRRADRLDGHAAAPRRQLARVPRVLRAAHRPGHPCGQVTNAVYGFTSMLIKVVRRRAARRHRWSRSTGPSRRSATSRTRLQGRAQGDARHPASAAAADPRGARRAGHHRRRGRRRGRPTT